MFFLILSWHLSYVMEANTIGMGVISPITGVVPCRAELTELDFTPRKSSVQGVFYFLHCLQLSPMCVFQEQYPGIVHVNVYPGVNMKHCESLQIGRIGGNVNRL